MVSTKSLGITLIALGIAIPVIAYVAGHVFTMQVASYGGPPNQGAMVVAYLAIRGALVVGACLAIAGLVLLLTALKKPINAEINKAR
jgi:hypothetical protein